MNEPSYYDTIIKYWDEEAWKKYFIEDLGNLYKSCNEIMAIRNYFKDKVDKRQLLEILSDESLFKVLLGGLREDGTFSEEGLAVFCNKFFGTGIDKQGEFIGRLKVGLSLQEASKDLKGTCTQTPFIEQVSKLVKSLGNLFYQLEIKGFVKISIPSLSIETMKDPKEVYEKVREFIQACLSISPNYNPYTFFILSLYRITRKYMELAYPRLKDEKVFNFIKEFLGLSEIIVPQIPNEEKMRDYTVWGFKEGSIGYEVAVNLVNIVWDIVDLDFIQKYFRIPSERRLYLDRAIEELEKVASHGKDWSDIIDGLRAYNSVYRLGILGLEFLPSQYHRFAQEGLCVLNGIYLGKMIFAKFMDYISPQLFLNVGFIDKIGSNVRWQAIIYE